MQTNVIIFMDRSAMMRQYPALTHDATTNHTVLSPATINMKGYIRFRCHKDSKNILAHQICHDLDSDFGKRRTNEENL